MVQKINKKNLLKTFVIYTSVILSFLVVVITNNITVHIFSLLLLALISVLVVKVDFYHPYTWYTPFFAMYSIAHPVLLLIGDSRINTYSKELIILQLVGLATFLIVVSPKKIESNELPKVFTRVTELNYINKYIYFILYIYTGLEDTLTAIHPFIHTHLFCFIFFKIH